MHDWLSLYNLVYTTKRGYKDTTSFRVAEKPVINSETVEKPKIGDFVASKY